MPNHTIFSLHNVNLMRHESNHFATMNAVMYFNQSSFSNSINSIAGGCLPVSLLDALAVLCGDMYCEYSLQKQLTSLKKEEEEGELLSWIPMSIFKQDYNIDSGIYCWTESGFYTLDCFIGT